MKARRPPKRPTSIATAKETAKIKAAPSQKLGVVSVTAPPAGESTNALCSDVSNPAVQTTRVNKPARKAMEKYTDADLRNDKRVKAEWILKLKIGYKVGLEGLRKELLQGLQKRENYTLSFAGFAIERFRGTDLRAKYAIP